MRSTLLSFYQILLVKLGSLHVISIRKKRYPPPELLDDYFSKDKHNFSYENMWEFS